MRIVRWLSASFVAALAAYALHGLTWKPFRCNITTLRVQNEALRVWKFPEAPRVAARARRAIVEMERCIASCPTNIDMYMTLALHDRLIGRFDHASAMYREALKYDRRPELFFNLGLVELEMRRRQSALLALSKACSFDIFYANDIPDVNLREEVFAAVYAERERGIAAARRQ